jgi:hypothetical protein
MGLVTPFVVFTLLAFIVLFLTFRWRFRTLVIAAALIGFFSDMLIDIVLVWVR